MSVLLNSSTSLLVEELAHCCLMANVHNNILIIYTLTNDKMCLNTCLYSTLF